MGRRKLMNIIRFINDGDLSVHMPAQVRDKYNQPVTYSMLYFISILHCILFCTFARWAFNFSPILHHLFSFGSDFVLQRFYDKTVCQLEIIVKTDLIIRSTVEIMREIVENLVHNFLYRYLHNFYIEIFKQLSICLLYRNPYGWIVYTSLPLIRNLLSPLFFLGKASLYLHAPTSASSFSSLQKNRSRYENLHFLFNKCLIRLQTSLKIGKYLLFNKTSDTKIEK